MSCHTNERAYGSTWLHSILALFFCISSVSHAEPKSSDLGKLMTELTESVVNSGDSVWPGLNWKGKDVYFVDPTTEQAWLHKIGSKQIKKVAFSRREFDTQSFHMIIEDGYKAMVINRNLEPKRLRHLLLHEGFHLFEQNDKTWKAQAESRGLSYPIDFGPRLLRLQVAKYLITSFQEDEPGYLNYAKYWHEQWKQKYPRDILLVTDNAEGSAEYFATVGDLVAEQGKNVDPAAIKKSMTEKGHALWNTAYSAALEKRAFEGSESYLIGTLAFAQLRLLSKSFANDLQRIKKGESVLDILFELAVSESNDPPFEEEVKFFKDAEKIVKTELDPFVEKSLAVMKSPDSVQIPLKLTGFNPKAFLVLDDDTRLIVLDGDHDVDGIELPDGTVLFKPPQPPSCASTYEYSFVSVPAASLKPRKSDGTHTFNFNGIKGKVSGEMVSHGGFKYLCPKAKSICESTLLSK